MKAYVPVSPLTAATAMLFAISFLFQFLVAGLTGIMVASDRF
jgi:heme/copper-type cytochrome/quinol oxidase subunit 1